MAYDAFLSYSHAADTELGAALQRGLHHLARPWYRLRALHVFRDKTSLSASPALWPSILTALAQSTNFVLLASPPAARSAWVRREVEWWRQHKTLDRLFIVVTAGELAWDENASDFDWTRTDCLPPELRGGFAAEPLWVDLRGARTRNDMSLRHSGFRLAILDLAAPMHGRPKDELDGEDVQQHRTARITAWGAGVALAILAILSTVAALAAWEQSQIGRSRELAALSVSQLSSDPDVALQLALESVRVRATPQAESALRRAVGNHYLRMTLEGHRSAVGALAVSSDGKWLASADQTEAIQLWDLASGKRVHRWTVKGVNSLSFTSDARLLVAAAERSARAWEVATGQPVTQTPEARDEVHQVLFDPARHLWILVDEDDGLLVPGPDPATKAWRRLGGTADQLKLVDDGKTLATLKRPYARFWEVATWNLVGELDTSSHDEDDPAKVRQARALGIVKAVAIPADGGRVVVAHYRSGEAFALAERSERTALSLNASGRWLATGGASGAVHLWDVDWTRQLREHRGHLAAVRALALSADGAHIASAGDDRRVRVWQHPMSDHRWSGADDANALSAAIGQRGMIVTTARSGPVRLLDARTGKARADIIGDLGFADCLAISGDGKVLAGSGQGIWLWRPDGEATRISEANVSGCAFRGETPVWITMEGRVVIGEMVLTSFEDARRSNDGDVLRSSLNPAATHLVANTRGSGILVWNLAESQPRTLAHPGEAFRTIEIAPDGRSFHACSDFGPVRTFDTVSLALIEEISLGGLACSALAASPDGRYLAVGGPPGRVVIFALADGAPIKTLHTQTDVTAVRFGPDSRALIVTEGSGRVDLFDCNACLDLPDLVALAGTRITRQLTPTERAVHLDGPSLISQLRRLFFGGPAR